MSLPPRPKYPTEIRVQTFDFSDKMNVAGGETIVGVVVTVPGGITSSAPSITGPLVSTRIGGGSAGQDYPVICEITTSLSQDLKLVMTLEVRDDAN